jgi:diguanylate cyclase (GGDEF)-like protein
MPLAFAGLALLIGLGALWMERALVIQHQREADARAMSHFQSEITALSWLARHAARTREQNMRGPDMRGPDTWGPDTHEAAAQVAARADILADLTQRIVDWRAEMTSLGQHQVAFSNKPGAGVSLHDAIVRGGQIISSHDLRLSEQARLLAEAAEAAGASISQATARDIAQAEAGRRDLRTLTLRMFAVLLAAVGCVGMFAVRPLAESFAERGRRLVDLEARMDHGTLHDPLTGLPNRRCLAQQLSVKLALAGREGENVAALHVNLDHFKSINASLGAAAGDRVLRRCATILRTETRAGDLVARVGADEFIIILTGVAEQDDVVVSLASRLIDILREPIMIDAAEARTGASIGIAIARPNQNDADGLLSEAGLALSDAKAAGRGRYSTIVDGRKAAFDLRRQIATELREGLARNELEPFFQPQVCARTGRPLGFEALVRWRHPSRGLLAPAHFLDVAQETGQIDAIGEVVTRRALSALATWRSMGLPAERISLNVSANELRDAGFVDRLSWDVDASGLEPCNIAIEILESVLIDDDSDPVIRNISALGAAGFSVELDDFGTGHASIANLKKFRVNKIKIDRSFITDIDTLPDQQKITRAMINLAHSLDVEALVEGVETEGELRRLRAMGCDSVQGYLIGRPMAEADALAWLQGQTRAVSAPWAGTPGPDEMMIGELCR